MKWRHSPNLSSIRDSRPPKKISLRKIHETLSSCINKKNIEESSTNRHFPDQNLNDESDAFRHFLWAALLTKELGEIRGKEFLDAHEKDPAQPDDERQMDIYNNGRGQTAANILLKEKRWSFKAIEAEGLEELRSKKLQVLKPGLPIPKESE